MVVVVDAPVRREPPGGNAKAPAFGRDPREAGGEHVGPLGPARRRAVLSVLSVSMIVLEPTEVRQQVISKPVAAGGGATALYKVTPFDGGFGGDDAKDELENTAL